MIHENELVTASILEGANSDQAQIGIFLCTSRLVTEPSRRHTSPSPRAHAPQSSAERYIVRSGALRGRLRAECRSEVPLYPSRPLGILGEGVSLALEHQSTTSDHSRNLSWEGTMSESDSLQSIRVTILTYVA